MSFYDQLLSETRMARETFLAIPLVQSTINSGPVTRELYAGFLTEAYHHVSHTFPLLALAASRTRDERYQDALFEYMKEERGHEKWILDDIRAIGGDADAVRAGALGEACRIMVGYSYYAIEHVSPYALLGSVHVLEGMSVMLAHRVADTVKNALGSPDDKGYSYLRSHGALDVAHVDFFKSLIDGYDAPVVQRIIIEQSRIFYRLYGAIFRDLGARIGLNHATA